MYTGNDGYYVAIVDLGRLRGPYPTFAAADAVVQGTGGSMAYVADEWGIPHAAVDPAVRGEILEDFDPAGVAWEREEV